MLTDQQRQCIADNMEMDASTLSYFLGLTQRQVTTFKGVIRDSIKNNRNNCEWSAIGRVNIRD